ncbi:MAG: hypothetical protein IV090_01830 [Candidatus Sericytochromatia bacterium]|nr:hypothetical protein [Candidatus Sericytochromatia bacterium]
MSLRRSAPGIRLSGLFWLFACLFWVSLCWAGDSFANDSSIAFEAGLPRLQSEKDVDMQAEKLVFSYRPPQRLPAGKACPAWSRVYDGFCEIPNHWVADLKYTFRNRGPARKLQIGLPFDMPTCPPESDINGPKACDPIENFGTWLDGQRVPVTFLNQTWQEAIPFNRVYLSEVPFARGQTRVLRHQYLSYHQSGIGGERFRYLLRTGSTWGQPIEKVEIAFELPPQLGPCALSNLPFQRRGNWLKIELRHWRPDRDLEIAFASRERALLGTALHPYGQAAEADLCAEARALDPQTRQTLLDQVKRLYGAPASATPHLTGDAWPLCANADYLSPHRDTGFALPFLPDPAWPGNLPSGLAMCLKELDNQP